MEEHMMEGDFQLLLAHNKTAKACGACRLAHTACDRFLPIFCRNENDDG